MSLELVIGDIYYTKKTSTISNIDTNTTTKITTDLFVRGSKFVHGELTMVCVNIQKNNSLSLIALCKYDDQNGWFHLGPGCIDDYPEYLL